MSGARSAAALQRLANLRKRLLEISEHELRLEPQHAIPEPSKLAIAPLIGARFQTMNFTIDSTISRSAEATKSAMKFPTGT